MIIPIEIQEKMRNIAALELVVEKSLNSFWGQKKSLKYAIERELLREDVHKDVHTLYPEVKRCKVWQWKIVDGEYEVFIIEE